MAENNIKTAETENVALELTKLIVSQSAEKAADVRWVLSTYQRAVHAVNRAATKTS